MKRAALALIAVMCAGCSPGGANIAALPATATAATSRNGTATFALTIPNPPAAASNVRRPAFVSPSTLSGTIAVNGGTAVQLDLSVGSTNCAAVTGGRVCTISAPAPIGSSDTFAIVLYDGPFVSSAHSGNALSAASTFTAPVVEGNANVSTPLVLGGIPATVDVATNTLTATPSTVAMTVTAYDHGGNIIIGPANYADASGAAAPLNVIVATTTTQVTLHDGTQSGTTIHVASPADVVTFQLNAPATILGAAIKVTNAASAALAAKNLPRTIPVGGALVATQTAPTITFFPDATHFAPSDASLVSGVPSGFAFSIEATGSGYIGFFDGPNEAFDKCAYSGYNLGVSPAPNGIAVGFNGADNVDTPPTGVTSFPFTDLVGSCSAGTSYTSNASFANSLAFDGGTNRLFEGGHNGTLSYDAFTPPGFSGNSTINVYGSAPHDLLAFNNHNFFLIGSGIALYFGTGTSVASTATASGATLTALAAGFDTSGDVVYALDTTAKRVWTFNHTSSLAAYTPSNAFTIALSAQSNNLAIGPDGSAYASDGNATVQSVTTAGVTATVAIPAPGGNIGYVRAVFDGHNGFTYAYYDDGLHAGIQYVFRISH